MINKPSVSVIMAEYNTNIDDLRAAIKSILDQTFSDFEFIIVDDGGKNDLQKIVSEFNDSRIRIVDNRVNKGLVYSLNNAIKHAKTEYLVRMDTDDIALPNRLQQLLSFIKNYPEYDVVGSRAIEFTKNTEHGILAKSGEKSKYAIMQGDTMVHPSVIMRKEAIVQVGGYPDYYRSEDLALWCELLLNGCRFYVLDDILLKYRVNPQDYKKRSLKNRRGEIQVRLHYYPKLGGGPREYFRIAKSIVAGLLPPSLVQRYRNKHVLSREENE